ncbi:MAG: hypothetical protein ACK47H_04085 [Akkermansiaceae bacterium]
MKSPSKSSLKTFTDKKLRRQKPEKFGDILMFTPDNSSVIHSCVYIAADMVFTKNGMGTHQPWTISEQDPENRARG